MAIIRHIAAFLILVNSCFSCQQNNQKSTSLMAVDAVKSPSITPLSKPMVVNMDSMARPEIHSAGYKNPIGQLKGTHLFINYNTEKGLPVNSFTSSMIDSRGYLWLGSNGAGAVRFDGKKFEQFTTANGLSNNGIWQMKEDTSGNIWFATYGGGLNCFDGKRFQNWQKQDWLSSNGIFCLSFQKDKLWLGTVESGVTGFNIRNHVVTEKINAIKDKPVRFIAADASGKVWIGNQEGVFFYYGKELHMAGEQYGIPKRACTSILTVNNNVWFGIENSGLFCFDGSSYQNYTSYDGLSGMTVTALHVDNQGRLWAATENGLSNFYNGIFTSVGLDEGLPKSPVTSMVSDKKGNLWLTTDGEGIFYYEGKEYQMIDKGSCLGGFNVHTMFEDHNGILWLGTIGGGVFKYANGILYRFTKKDGLVSDDIWSMAEDKSGNMWFGSMHSGVSRFDGRNFVNFTMAQGLSNNMIRSISCSSDGSVWLATTGGGVNHLKDNLIEQFHVSNGLCSEIILCVFEDHAGNLWFGTVGQGLCRFDGKQFTTFNETNGLANNIVIAIHEDTHHNIWVATEGGGISRFDGLSLMSFNTNNGLPNNTVYGIDQDQHGYVWAGSNAGLSKLIFRNEENTAIVSDNPLTNQQLKNYALVPKNYTRQNGFPFKDMSSGQHAMIHDRSGVIWAGTADSKYGLVRLEEKQDSVSFPAIVRLQSVSLEGKPVSWYHLWAYKNHLTDSIRKMMENEEVVAFGRKMDSLEQNRHTKAAAGISFEQIHADFPVPVRLSLPYEHNDISFSFVSIEPSQRQALEYRYKLPGYSDEWSLPSQNNTARFGNVHEGRYTFMVSSRFNQGRWGPVTTYVFEVRPPWYRSRLMYFIYVLIAAGVVFGYSRWKLYRLVKANRLLEKKVEQRTQEVVLEKENVEREKKKSDELLLNILPEETARELKLYGRSLPRRHEQVTIMFTDFKNFTQACENMTPQEMVEEINYCYSAFDRIIAENGLEKIKTIGDSYMCAAGIPVSIPDHAVRCVKAALDIRDFMNDEKSKRLSENRNFFDIRIGLHSGPVVAGIVGTRKFAYDIWGDSVNIASRMESSGETGMVNISEATYLLIKNDFDCTCRGMIEAKNKSDLKMYFVISKIDPAH